MPKKLLKPIENEKKLCVNNFIKHSKNHVIQLKDCSLHFTTDICSLRKFDAIDLVSFGANVCGVSA